MISEDLCDSSNVCWKCSFAIPGKVIAVIFHNITVLLYFWSNKCILENQNFEFSFKNMCYFWIVHFVQKKLKIVIQYISHPVVPIQILNSNINSNSNFSAQP